MRVWGGIVGGLALAVALSGCVGGVAPPTDRPSAGRSPIAGTSDPRPKPDRVHPVRDAGNSENIRGIQTPARIVGAVPILPVPIAPPFAPADRAVADLNRLEPLREERARATAWNRRHGGAGGLPIRAARQPRLVGATL